MSKNLNEMTAEEIAKAFPVELSPYDNEWPKMFEAEKERIVKTLGSDLIRIEHFGSTSVQGIIAKNTIDILAEFIPDETRMSCIIERMKTLEYDYMWQEDGEPPYGFFAKGFSGSGIKNQTYFIHTAAADHKLWDRLYFRDYLREYPAVAAEYEALKIQLAEKFKYNRVGYRIAKTDFVVATTEKAKAYYTAKQE